MKGRLVLAVLAFGLLLAVPAWAGGKMTVRMVKASGGEALLDPQLADVKAVLGEMPAQFKRFELLAKQEVALPADSTLKFAGGFVLICKGQQKAMEVQVQQDGKPLLKSTVALQDTMPLVVGGFPVEGGKMLFVLLTQ